MPPSPSSNRRPARRSTRGQSRHSCESCRAFGTKPRESGRDTAVAANRVTKATVFDDIAVAHGEIYALYQIAQTMGTSLGVSPTRWRTSRPS